jgi:prephenate dehydrogenase
MKVGIVGLGLMGASFGRTVKSKTEDKVFGFDKDETVMLKASLINCIDGELNEDSIKDIDLLIVSVYTRDFYSVVINYLPFMKKGAVVLDFCGNKSSVCSDMKALSIKYPDINFIGGHPMAGREFSGIDRSIKTLFEKASMLLVPVKCDIFTTEMVKKYFLALGFGEVIFTDEETHDKTIAFTSQLCHIVSNAYIKSETAREHHGFSAGSYRDLTRVARLNAKMWSELMTDNSKKLSNELGVLIENLQKYKKALDNGDERELYNLLEEGNNLKLEIDARKS